MKRQGKSRNLKDAINGHRHQNTINIPKNMNSFMDNQDYQIHGKGRSRNEQSADHGVRTSFQGGMDFISNTLSNLNNYFQGNNTAQQFQEQDQQAMTISAARQTAQTNLTSRHISNKMPFTSHAQAPMQFQRKTMLDTTPTHNSRSMTPKKPESSGSSQNIVMSSSKCDRRFQINSGHKDA